MKKFTRVMKALSDPTRVKIVKMLQRKKMCVCEIQEALGIAQSTASKHLKTLEEAGLATYKKDGLWVNYTLADGSDSPYAASMLGNLRHWLEDDHEVEELVRRLPAIRREEICCTHNPRAKQARG
ncbi:MAG: metalloregulator ArsR/SmtB family transcription factor [Desulfosalsimonas sp.]